MSQESVQQMTGAVTIPELIGRKAVLEAVFQAVRDPQPVLHVLYLSGEGGLGKTRLLQYVLEEVRTAEQVYVPETLLDLYHVELHTLEGFMREVVRLLPEEVKPAFKEYEKAYQRFNELRVYQEGSLVEQQDRVREAFQKGMQELCAKRRVVLMLDTVERAVYQAGEEGEPRLADTIRWLKEWAGQWNNLTLIFAGRKRAEAVWTLFQSTYALPQENAIPISPLSLNERREYLKALEQHLRKQGNDFVADRLAHLPEEVLERVCRLSEGRPILLSLLADYFSVAGRGQLPPALESSADSNREALEAQLVSRFMESGDLGETITAIGRAPRGVDAPLLAKLLDIPENEARIRLQDVRPFAFIKARADETYFLHDEMYALIKRQVYETPEDAPKASNAFEVIKKDLENRLRNVAGKMDELYAPVLKGSSETLRFNEIAEAYNARRKWLGFKLFYFLYYDFERGLRHFFRFSQEARRAQDVWMDLQLESELWDYLSTYSPHASDERLGGAFSKKLLETLLRVKELQHASIAREDQRVEELREELEARARKEDWETRMPVALLALYTFLGDIYAGRGTLRDSQKAEGYLHKALNLFPDEVETYLNQGVDEAAKRLTHFTLVEVWYLKAILARALFSRAYLERMRGNLKESVPYYQKAMTLLRQVNLQVDLAAVLNDLGYTQAMLGNWETAYRLIQDGLKLHQGLSAYASLCFDLNALSRAKIMEGYSLAEAVQLASRALALSRALGFKRGVAMSCRNLAEARRRSARSELLSTAEKEDLLRQAREHAYEARDVFQQNNETVRLIEAWMEIGCTTRDWVKLRVHHPAPTVSVERLVFESRKAFEEAIRLAQSENLFHKELDARVNLAWLEYYRLNDTDPVSDELRKRIEEVDQRIPKPESEALNPEIWVWAGKLAVLKGVVKFHQLNQISSQKRKEFSAGRENENIQSLLEEIGENFAEGLEYSRTFSENSQGIRNATQDIYERLKHLNTAEMSVLCRKVKQLYPQGSALERFLREVMLLVE
ncbi:tetratricopeptide repeat protein [Anaerolinea thermophila]|uniref:tetratricopeptide repeat protein n=1 Tax=Anaerolinea thermophila TaxID=167964 RepID=UPI0026EE9664|nr:tetratricopeptide repeat protein [Anaerolinea thermophila]